MAELSELTKAEAVQKLQYARNMLAKARDEAMRTMSVAKGAVETGGTALLLGYWHGRTAADNPDFEQFGVPVDLALGIGLHGLGLFGVAKGFEDDIHAVANGALAHYAARAGMSMGAEATEGAPSDQAAVAGVGYGAFPQARPRRVNNPFQYARAAA